MTAVELVLTLRGAGLTLTAVGDDLVVRPRELLTDELRAAIRDHKQAILAEISAMAAAVDPGLERRRAKALAQLAADPDLIYATVAEVGEQPGQPAHIMVAIRDVGSGELEISAATYQGLAVLALLEKYGSGVPMTTH